MTNDAWGCDTTATLGNTATLVPSDDAPIKANGVVQIYTGPCSQGCTRTIGYWKTHAGLNGKNPDRVTPLLPVYLGEVSGAKTKVVASSSAAVQALSMKWGNPSNGITKLYAQLLGTKLSIRSGADGSVVYGIIQDADAFLANYNENDWSSLNQARRKMVLAWVSAFDDFNNGLLGPAHCD